MNLKFLTKFTAWLLLALVFNQIEASAQRCLPEGIVFVRQTQIDSFPFLYSGCHEIEGSVTIGTYGSGNGAITSLQGLGQLKRISGELKIWYNDSLRHLQGLDSLSSVGSALIMEKNHLLQNFHGLEGLNIIGGSCIVSDNRNLTTLQGLEALSDVRFFIQFDWNPSLRDLSALENLRHVGGLSVFANHALVIVSGLDGLEEVEMNLEFSHNDSLRQIEGLNGLTEVGNFLWFTSNPSLKTVTGLAALTRTGGFVGFQDNPVLTSIEGLKSLTYIGSGFFLWDTDSLLHLPAFDNLFTINGNISFGENARLKDLSGLEKVDPSLINILLLRNNPALSDCAVKSICDFLALPVDTLQLIESNATGCNTREEIMEACEEKVIPDDQPAPLFTLYPNPAVGWFSVKGPVPFAVTDLKILDFSGRMLKTLMALTGQFDISGFPRGIYVVEFAAAGRLNHALLSVQP
ncbi:MAG: T9SS type A sorting domain-containing protein [Alphaproteobacteria bacterium]|nr:T9SS type A sorting domain-containing protein [Alphaproteobacteria bacterium]